ncbi:exported protein of unknown function [Candidatus Nitrosocosmicus franklandus]|uniref:Uncharacterized protein n=2 Tax=Candidatus Nitrosocosmicus franklandianus TaxID=1798806 RepID=A0A484IDH2_9ARCH|nr:exported protein of unknown function [Candidatus Nitrosocosmicus franklandus]
MMSCVLGTILISIALTTFLSNPFSNIDQDSNSFVNMASATTGKDDGGDSNDESEGASGGDNGDNEDNGDSGTNVDDGESVPSNQPEGEVFYETADQFESTNPQNEQETKSEVCTNGVDDDGDELIDSGDSDCNEIQGFWFDHFGGPKQGIPAEFPGQSIPGSQTVKHESICDDGIDNDSDGLADKKDPDCVGGLPTGVEVVGEEDTGAIQRLPGPILTDKVVKPQADDSGTTTPTTTDGGIAVQRLPGADKLSKLPSSSASTGDSSGTTTPTTPSSPPSPDSTPTTPTTPSSPPSPDSTPTTPTTPSSPPSPDSTPTTPTTPTENSANTPPLPGSTITTSQSPARIPPPQVIINSGTFTLPDRSGSSVSTSSPSLSNCSSRASTLPLATSLLQDRGARLIVALGPCTVTDGSVLLNLPETDGLELIVANMQGNQVLQSAVVPLQKVASLAPGQTLYNVDLNEVMTGKEPVLGNEVTLNGNINALLLWNNAGQEIIFNPQNSVSFSTALR